MLNRTQKLKRHTGHTKHSFRPGHKIMLRRTSYHQEKHICEGAWKWTVNRRDNGNNSKGCFEMKPDNEVGMSEDCASRGVLACHSSYTPKKAAGNWDIIEASRNRCKVNHLHLSCEQQMLVCFQVWRRIKLSPLLLIDYLWSQKTQESQTRKDI